jgi:hypothetical protein
MPAQDRKSPEDSYLEGYLQRSLRPRAFRGHVRRELKRLAFSDPSLDIVEASFTTQLMEWPDIVGRLSKRAMALTSAVRHGARF